MKSLNVRKIAAVAAGAALIGTALAGAAVTVDENLGNYVFLQNGEPQVKIAVGSAALPTDAIWAGNIAAALANKAYTTAEAAPAASGSSTTVAPVMVSVQTTANAVPAGTYGFTSFLGDDDVDNGADNTYNRTATAPGYNGALAPTKEISSSTSSLVQDGSVDTKGKYTSAITVREYVNLAGSVDYSSSSDKFIVRTPRAWYSLTYSPGLPACLDSTLAFNVCSTNNRLDRAGITLRFLGSNYLVSEVAMSGNVWNSLTLSKASVDQVVAAGSKITSPEGYSVDVQSISAPQGSGSVSSVALIVRSPSNATESLTITAGAAPTKVLGSVYVQVPDAFYVATGTSTARVIFSTGSLRLVQNTTVDESIFGKWQASFTTNNLTSTGSQGISRLQLGNDFQPGTLSAGEGLDIVTGAPGYRWTFQGSTLISADFNTLAIESTPLDSIQLNGNTTSCSFATVKFTSSKNDAFRIGSDQKSTVWFLAKNKTSGLGCNTWVGYWLYLNSSSVYANTTGTGIASVLNNTNVQEPLGDTGFTTGITFYYPGTGTDVSVPLNISTNSGRWNLTAAGAVNISTGNATYVNVTIPEILNESTTTTEGSWNIPFVFGSGSAAGSATASDLTVRDSLGLTTAGKVNYTAPARVAAAQAASYFGEVPLYSPRGSYVGVSPTTTTYTVYYASKLGRAQFVLSTQGTNLTAGTSSVSCTPGVSCNVGGQQITIPTGAGAAGSSNQVAVQLNTATQPLVVLDSEASSTQPLIVVGGPFVNSVAASMEAASLFDTCDPSVGGDAFVQVEGNKVLVAGCSADDTMEAAKELIGFLASWSPAGE